MKRLIQRSTALFGAIVLSFILLSNSVAKTTVFVIGDSTASIYNSGDYP